MQTKKSGLHQLRKSAEFISTAKKVSLGVWKPKQTLGRRWRNRQSYFKLIKAQREVQDLGELLGQRLLPLQVLSGVVVSLAGQSSKEAVQRRLWGNMRDIWVRGRAWKHQPFSGKCMCGVSFYSFWKDPEPSGMFFQVISGWCWIILLLQFVAAEVSALNYIKVIRRKKHCM